MLVTLPSEWRDWLPTYKPLADFLDTVQEVFVAIVCDDTSSQVASKSISKWRCVAYSARWSRWLPEHLEWPDKYSLKPRRTLEDKLRHKAVRNACSSRTTLESTESTIAANASRDWRHLATL